MLERRYEAYKDIVVRPFFRDHFARLDRQIVLVDTLRALNAGPAAVADLETALTDILGCFRQGDSNPLHAARRRAASTASCSPRPRPTTSTHTSHDRLEAILNRLVADAARRAKFAGAETRSLALAAIRATREGAIDEGGETLDGHRRHADGRARCSTASPMTARPKSPCFPATCRTIRTRCSRTAARRTSTSCASCRRAKLERNADGDARAAAYPLRSRARFPDRRLAEMKRPIARPIARPASRRPIVRAPARLRARRRSRSRPRPSRPIRRDAEEPLDADPAAAARSLARPRSPGPPAASSSRSRLGLAADRLIRDLFAAQRLARLARPRASSPSASLALLVARHPRNPSRCGACASSTGCATAPLQRSLSDQRDDGRAVAREPQRHLRRRAPTSPARRDELDDHARAPLRRRRASCGSPSAR